GAIRNIGKTIAEINQVTTTIAAAVEEQGSATHEIARNIQQAAGGTSEVSSNITGVSTASAQAGTAASDVLRASETLRSEAEVLRAGIDTFLKNIRAAWINLVISGASYAEFVLVFAETSVRIPAVARARVLQSVVALPK